MAGNKGRRTIAAIVVLIGAVLLIVAAFTPWYMESFSGYGATITQNAYPGVPTSNGTIQYTCSGLPSEVACPSQTSYNKADLNNTGAIAEAGFFMVIVGFILGLIGAIMGLMSRNNPRRAGTGMALAAVAMILAIAAVGMFAVALPGAISKDTPGHSGSGPWSTFTGSTNASGFGIPVAGNVSWGPSIGWYLSIAAFVVLLIGAVLLFRYRKDPASPAPATVPAPGPMMAPAAAPPASPPSS